MRAVALFLLTACLATAQSTAPAPGRDFSRTHTVNEKNGWVVQYFHVVLDSLAIDSAGAHLRAQRDQGEFKLIDPRDREQWANKMVPSPREFTLSRPGEVFSVTYHHCQYIFTVKSISPSDLVIEYILTSDENTFDEGEVRLEPFSKRRPNQAMQGTAGRSGV